MKPPSHTICCPKTRRSSVADVHLVHSVNVRLEEISLRCYISVCRNCWRIDEADVHCNPCNKVMWNGSFSVRKGSSVVSPEQHWFPLEFAGGGEEKSVLQSMGTRIANSAHSMKDTVMGGTNGKILTGTIYGNGPSPDTSLQLGLGYCLHISRVLELAISRGIDIPKSI